jgi:hypothetical protein
LGSRIVHGGCDENEVEGLLIMIFEDCKWFVDMVIDAAVNEFGHYSNYVFCCCNKHLLAKTKK